MTTARRRSALAASLPDDVDAILVTRLVNVRYLSGFTGSNGVMLVTRDDDAVLATDGRYQQQAAAQAPDVKLVDSRTLAADLLKEAAAAGVRRVAIERHDVTLALHDDMLAAAGGVELADAGQPVEQLRAVKDETEIAALARACAVTDEAFAEILELLQPGVTERDIAWRLLAAMRRHDAEAAFDSIVAFGANSSMPHHEPTDRPLARGDLVKLDFGARVDGYHADMTRTVVCGPAAAWQRELHAQVRDVQEKCRAATVVGAVPVELDALARRLVDGHGHRLVHGLGHGVGLEIHERPSLGPNGSTEPLRDGIPVTVEPGIYLPDRGGVRIEDTVVVGANETRSLTQSRRELLEV